MVALVGATPNVLPKLMASTLSKRPVVLLYVPPVILHVARVVPEPRVLLELLGATTRVPLPFLVKATAAPELESFKLVSKVVIPPLVAKTVPSARESVPFDNV